MKSTGHYCLIKFQNGLCLTLAILCSCSLFTKGFSQTHNYSEALQKALFFYETQTSGYTPLDHRVEWRGDSCIRDGSDVGRDLTGGWYDAGDGVVWTGNDAFGATMLAWALYRHRQIFIQTGQYQIAIDRVREISNYLEKIVQLDSNGNVVRIYCGKGAIRNSPPNDPAPRNDRTDGCPNEVMDTVVGGSPQTVRPSYWVDSSTGGADVAGAVAAALAANSIVLREYGDVARANQLLELAKKVYNWGEANPNQQLTIDGTTTTRATRRLTNGQVVTIPDYPSRISTWTSRMIYACAWLHRADIAAQTPGYTNTWVTKAHTLYNSPENASRRNRHWSVFTTGQEHNGAYTMLAADTGNSTFVAEANAYANFWLYDRSNHTGRTTDPTVTPEGFIARGQEAAWNVNYLLDQAPPLLDWADSSHNTNSTQKNRLIALFTGTYNAGNNECPVKQIDYILGSNSKKLSYLAGYKPQGTGYDWVRNLLYRSTNWDYGGFGTPTADKTQWNRFVPYGVVAPGPDHTDYYPQNVPLTSGYVLGYQEPIIYSGGILTVLARNIAAGGPFAGQPLHTFPEWEQRPSDYQTRYFFAQAILDSSNRTTVYVNNRAVFPPREINTLGFRFYFTPDGVAGNQVTCSATGIGLLSGETVQVTGPFQVGTSSTWYFNIRLVNAMVVPGEFGRYYRRVQLTFSQPSGTFSFSNDHSGAAITSTLSTIANIPVYDTAGGNWQLLGGFEPSAGYIQWRRAHFNNVMEQAPSVVLIAERVGGTQGAVSASVSLTPGSASTADYGSPSPATLSWSNGESGEKTVSIPLTNDSWDEGREYFTATLGSFTGGAQAGIITTARVSIEDNDFGGPKETGSLVQIIGNNIVIGKDDLQPDLADHTDFGATAVNNTSAAITRTFTIRNLSSNTTLSLTGSPRVQISGSNATDFTVTSQPPATIAANSSATFSVQFLPSQTGTRNATINIPYTLGNPSNYTFAIRGIGTAAASSAGLEVEEITILNETAYLVSQPYTIRNNGYGTLNWTAILPTNYWAISSSTPGGPQYEWIDITSPGPKQGTAITSWGASSTLRDNAVSNTIDIGFSLPFYGQQRSQLRISTNGFLTFNTATTDSVPSNTSLPSSASPGSLVAPWWDDLVLPANQGNVFYRRVDADTFVVTWHRAAYLVGGNPVGDISFQAILKRDGRIIFQYKDIGSPTDSNAYTIGIQNANAANQSSLFAFNSLVAQPGTAVEFRPPGTGDFDPAGSSGNPLSLSTYSGSIGPQGNQTISIYFDPNGLASGQAYRTYFVLQTNDPNNPEYTIPVRLVISREFRLEAIDATNRPWETTATWTPSYTIPGPNDRLILDSMKPGGGSLRIDGPRSLYSANFTSPNGLSFNGTTTDGTGSNATLFFNNIVTITNGNITVGSSSARLQFNGGLLLSGGLLGFASGSTGGITVPSDVPITLGNGTLSTLINTSGTVYSMNLGTGRITLTDTNGTIHVPSDTFTLNRTFTGSGGFRKTGNGTLVLTAQGTDNLGTIEIAQGTLRFGNNDILSPDSRIRLAGGSIHTNGKTAIAGPLELTANSTINFSGGGGILFANSANQTWGANANLAIINYNATNSVLRFGTSSNHISSSQIAKITVNGQPITAANINSEGYYTPNPSIWASGWPKADTPTTQGFTLRARFTANGTAYYVVLPDGASAPNATQVKNGQNATNQAALKAGNLTITANTENSAVVTALTSNTAYDVYFAAENSTAQLETNVIRVDVSTLDVASLWSSGWPKADTPTTDGFTVRAQLTQPGKAYWVILADNATAPTSSQVKNGQNASNQPAIQAGNFTLAANTENSSARSGLNSDTPYDVYFAAEDSVGNLQTNPTKVDVSTLPVSPSSFTWNHDGNGNWTDTTRWNPNGTPNGTDVAAVLGPIITATRTITLNTNATLGNLTFNEDTVTNNAYTVSFSANTSLTFNTTSGNATLNARGTGGYALGTQANNSTVQLNSNLTISAGSSGTATSEAGTIAINSQILGNGSLILSSLNSNDGSGTAPNGVRGTFLRSTVANTFTGGILVQSGFLGLSGNISNAGSGNITLSASDSSNGGLGTSLILQTGGGTLPNPIHFANPEASAGTNPRLAFQLRDSSTQNYTFTGGLFGNLGNQTLRIQSQNQSSVNTNSTLTLSGNGSALSIGPSAIVQIRNGYLILNHPHAVGPNNTVGNGTTGGWQVANFSNNTIGFAALLTNGFNVSGRIFTNSATSAGNTNNDTILLGGIHTAGTATFTGNIQVGRIVSGSRELRLTSAAGGTTVFSGTISDAAPSGSANAVIPLVKVGQGTVILTAANTFNGGLTISEGTLLANNPTGSATGSGNVTVQNGARLGGTGTISGNVTLQAGALLRFDLITANASHDRLDVGGTLALNNTNIELVSSNGQASQGTYVLIQAGSITGTPGSVSAPANFTANASVSGNQLLVTLTPSLTPLEQWRQTHFSSPANSGNGADSADPDADGIPNLIEYALGGTPTNPTSRPQPTVGTATVSGQQRLTLTFTPQVVSGLTYLVQASNDLSDWSTQTDVTSSLTAGQPYTFTDSADLATTPRRFLRLRVQVNP